MQIFLELCLIIAVIIIAVISLVKSMKILIQNDYTEIKKIQKLCKVLLGLFGIDLFLGIIWQKSTKYLMGVVFMITIMLGAVYLAKYALKKYIKEN